MNKLSTEKQAAILRALVEGNSIRATSRMVGCSKNTVSRLLRLIGEQCLDSHDELVRNVETDQVQADEIWSFVGCKEKHVPKEQKHQGRGDVWTFTAICRASKLLISYRVGRPPDQRGRAGLHGRSGGSCRGPHPTDDGRARHVSDGGRAGVRVSHGGLRDNP